MKKKKEVLLKQNTNLKRICSVNHCRKPLEAKKTNKLCVMIYEHILNPKEQQKLNKDLILQCFTTMKAIQYTYASTTLLNGYC